MLTLYGVKFNILASNDIVSKWGCRFAVLPDKKVRYETKRGIVYMKNYPSCLDVTLFVQYIKM